MSTHVAFLRAVNVAGHARVRMSVVTDAFVAAGSENVRNYIQSGNILFDAPENSVEDLRRRLRLRLRDVLGEEPGIFIRTARQLSRIVQAAPFAAYEAEPAVKLYVAFLSRKPETRPVLPLPSPKERLGRWR